MGEPVAHQWSQHLPGSTQAATWKSGPGVAGALICQETPDIFCAVSPFVNVRNSSKSVHGTRVGELRPLGCQLTALLCSVRAWLPWSPPV